MQNILKKLNKVQVELKVPKGQKNNFGNYMYRNAEDILEAVKPLLGKYELVLNIKDNVITRGEGENTRFYVESTVKIIDTETSEFETSVGLAREEETKKGMDASQITGSSSSYARKYALNGLFAIDDTKDSDTTNTHGKDDAKITKTQIDKINELVLPENMDNFLKYHKVKKIEDITEKIAQNFIDKRS